VTATSLLRVLWPAFFAAGALEMFVFAFVDPSELHLPSGALLDWPRQMVYTLAFFVFWAIVAAAGFTMRLLDRPGATATLDRVRQ
jgi:hypothetical protein